VCSTIVDLNHSFVFRYRLLASKGFDAEKLSKSLNLIDVEHTFEPLEAIQDTDVESYLRHEHEMAIVAVIEEARRNVSRY
jgi:nuclear pore complex protein Nup93